MKRLHPLGVVLLLLLAGCFSAYDTPKPGEMRVRRGRFASTMVLTGELEAARGAVVSVPELPSWQSSIKWLINDGVAVQAGERVAELDNTPFTADLDKKKQDETQAQQELQEKDAEWTADLRDKQFDLEKKRGELEKAKLEAAVPSDIVSSREYEDRQTKLRRATTDYAKARATLAAQQKADASDRANLLVKIDRAQRELTIAQQSIDSLILRAPRAGIVVVKDIPWEGRKLQAGDTVWVGFPIALIPEIDSMRVTASLPDVDDGRVLPGMVAHVTLDGYPTMHFNGRVAGVSAVAQEGARGSLRRAFVVIVKLDQVDGQRMRPGLSARVEVDREAKNGVLIAPRAAFDFSGKAPRARLSGGKLVNVTLGSCNAQDCIVTSGLEEGSRLGS
jgi:HlyD family secretion protein